MTEIVAIVVLVIVVTAVIVIYNRLVALKHRVANAFAQIDVQLKRRHDLIPKLVEVAKAYMSYERETLERVIAARNAAQSAEQRAAARPTDAQAIDAMVQAEGSLSRTLGGFFALVESYPDLKANTTMVQLAEELTTTENRIAFARQAYNDAVMHLNVGIESFPAVVIAGPFGFQRGKMLQPLGRGEAEPPELKL